ncbi:uncharacterized protein B0H18DRAFT_981666 [Fomitopsis serialis]|uniref:uncharacterized protein n=1 Tax=Fomitopsis serialis TaxID=139415 RepID=UPI002007D1A0|nr:uncharacterized protein B0H18DRAFT_981666 [Neoantrodia serialis]KAH9934398.1 hypothetical protein B0H18DRAFT_981666 [Neoantrodia serialis]
MRSHYARGFRASQISVLGRRRRPQGADRDERLLSFRALGCSCIAPTSRLVCSLPLTRSPLQPRAMAAWYLCKR